jgi:pyridoxamine 5'-phosphate oxidase
MPTIAAIRREYKLKSLNEKDAAPNPIDQFTTWWMDAVESEIAEVNAMTLCTVTPNGKPNGRIVLLKGYDETGFTFFTNYHSQKGIELSASPFVTLVFFWKELERQVRISGSVTILSETDNDAYFQSRPRGSQLGAWASPQSHEIESREVLEQKLIELDLQYDGGFVPRPPHWGGYRVIPESIEFWQGRTSRLHARLLYTKKLNDWNISRLAP